MWNRFFVVFRKFREGRNNNSAQTFRSRQNPSGHRPCRQSHRSRPESLLSSTLWRWPANSPKRPNATKLPRLIKNLIKIKLLVLDEVGYIELIKQQASLLFQVISMRYEAALPLLLIRGHLKTPFQRCDNLSSCSSMSTELGFFDYLERVEQLATRPTALDQLNQCIDWSSFGRVLRENLDYKKRSKAVESPIIGS